MLRHPWRHHQRAWRETTPKTDNPDNLAQWEWWLRHSFVSPFSITKSPAAIITRSIRGVREREGGRERATRIRWMVRYYVSISKRRIFTVIAIGSRCQEYSNNEWWTKINGIRLISYSWRSTSYCFEINLVSYQGFVQEFQWGKLINSDPPVDPPPHSSIIHHLRGECQVSKRRIVCLVCE